MVDNFNKTEKFFNFNGDDFFIFAQLVRRQKDTPNKKIKEGSIKTWILRSFDDLMKVHDDMVAMAEVLSARIYINLSPKSFKTVDDEMMIKLAVNNKAHQALNPNKIINSAIGVTKSKKPKWVVDVDDINTKLNILGWLLKEDAIIYDEFPTKNGFHYIISPVNVNKFENDLPTIDLHPNSMGTILYVPKSLD